MSAGRGLSVSQAYWVGSGLSFSRPLLLLVLLVVPAGVCGCWWARRRPVRYAVRFTNLELLAAVAGRVGWRRRLPPLLFLLSFVSASLALARPYLPRLVPVEGASVILAIDTSGSMRAGDVKPSRLGAAEQAARAFLARTPRRLRVGLVAFADAPQVAAPATSDHALVREAIDLLSPEGGTAIGDAIAAALRLGRQALAATSTASHASTRPAGLPVDLRGLVAILLLSDGSQTSGTLQPLQAARQAEHAGVPIYTIALGTANGTIITGEPALRVPTPVPPDPITLRAIAKLTGGQFTNAKNASILTHAYSRLGHQLGRRQARTEISFAFLAAAASLLVAASALATLGSPPLP